MLCSLSGEEAQEPVVSPKSGCIFEKRLIELYISTTGKDPISEEALTTEELIVIQNKDPVIVPPRPAAFNSIPTMLQAFQNEWDALALETFTLRKELNNTRQELSASLYQYDAAVRVANKALKERDEAREALTELSQSFAKNEPPVDEKLSDGVEEKTEESIDSRTTESRLSDEVPLEKRISASRELPGEVAQNILEAGERLFREHKNLKITLDVLNAGLWRIHTSETTHDIQRPFGQLAVGSTGKAAVFGLNSIFIYPEGKVMHKRANIMNICFTGRGDQVLAACNNNTIYIQSINGGPPKPLNHKAGEIHKIIAHPSVAVSIGFSPDYWTVFSYNRPVYRSERVPFKMSFQALHVDGRLLAIGTSHPGQVLIYDIVTNERVASINTKYPRVNKIQFAYNGYWLFVASNETGNGVVQLFDLRKNSLVQQFEYSDRVEFAIDKSSQVLAVSSRAEREISFSFYDKKAKQWDIDVLKLDSTNSVNLIEHVDDENSIASFLALSPHTIRRIWLRYPLDV
ncbi:hypothetical protein C7M61_000033 [Candidozyma pseudohaemuli]|uniref:Pre-mRNA-processing factor 19 n=1 Tax=Candidozyma pseudohaemuli TaxID=418784 RepID=A0A2P7YWQ4_9ASCO|nr:hypothetical protein C7M61_000033 [[Candida] pseudohaemulonii]PSK40398.1 hypothetical protein C7M61_000033 [[Candida] pseudohaemulonii]